MIEIHPLTIFSKRKAIQNSFIFNALNSKFAMKNLNITTTTSTFYYSTRIPLETSLTVKNAALSRLRERLLSKTYEASQENECSFSGDREKPASQRSKLGSRGALVQ